VLGISLNSATGGIMIASKMSVLKPLIESKEGQHLTAYLKNDQSVSSLQNQLRDTLDAAHEYLSPVINSETLVRFLAPINGLVRNPNLLSNLKGNVGIFRNEDSFRILSLPVAVEQTCVVANSFHVKPLLKWIQIDREFFLLGIDENSSTLFLGNQNSVQPVDSLIYPSAVQKHLSPSSYKGKMSLDQNGRKSEEITQWLNEWLFKLTRTNKPTLFMAGSHELSRSVQKHCRYKNKHKELLWPAYRHENATEVCFEIRSFLKKAVKKELELSLLEFYEAEDLNLGHKNIFQIARATVRGKVRKLIIADDISIFGKIDKNTGGLSIHPTHIDHEDDDLLDDLAQEVLAQGGEVVVASRDEIPKGRPILAILRSSGSDLNKHHPTHATHEIETEGSSI